MAGTDTVRAKFRCSNISPLGTGSKLELTPVYDMTIDEDRRFSKATPSGKVELVIDNPPAVEFFELGKSYYIDFTKAA